VPRPFPTDLPSPSPELAAHADAVERHIVARIESAGGQIPFAEYMRLALYAPGLGYYSAGARKFGAAGDFTTAPERSQLFSRVVARQCGEVLATIGGGDILELGGGTGAMAAEVLCELAAGGQLPGRYRIMEVSADLRERQRATLVARAPALLDRLEWLDSLDALQMDGVILGNEVLDALPVERFRIDGERILQQVVGAEAGGLTLDWAEAPAVLSDAVRAIEADLGRRLADAYVSEVSLGAAGWLAGVAAVLSRGAVLLSDYGYGRRDYYAPERSAGTLMCHYRQHAHEDPLLLPGAQDITAWVDFTRVAEALDAAGLGYLGFTNQAQFLLAGGLADLAAPALEAGGRGAIELSAEVKTLTLPGEMGERFRFIGFGRGIDRPPSGFTARDFGTQL
jgi:SAM-dependent MidA family methyltransferase